MKNINVAYVKTKLESALPDMVTKETGEVNEYEVSEDVKEAIKRYDNKYNMLIKRAVTDNRWFATICESFSPMSDRMLYKLITSVLPVAALVRDVYTTECDNKLNLNPDMFYNFEITNHLSSDLPTIEAVSIYHLSKLSGDKDSTFYRDIMERYVDFTYGEDAVNEFNEKMDLCESGNSLYNVLEDVDDIKDVTLVTTKEHRTVFFGSHKIYESFNMSDSDLSDLIDETKEYLENSIKNSKENLEPVKVTDDWLSYFKDSETDIMMKVDYEGDGSHNATYMINDNGVIYLVESVGNDLIGAEVTLNEEKNICYYKKDDLTYKYEDTE